VLSWNKIVNEMDWLKEHEYLAAWIGLVLALIAIIPMFTKKPEEEEPIVTWLKRLGCVFYTLLLLLTCVTVILMPTTGIVMRIYAGAIGLVAFFVLIMLGVGMFAELFLSKSENFKN
jgi:NADH:ubiquinone oxidoreductase subunit 6 (subunit J)